VTEEKLKNIKKIIDLYFSPWGAAKAAMWEELSNDGPFSPETALELIKEVIQK